MIRGACEDCGKRYKGLPSADRTYRCKECGGTVRAADGSGEPAEEPREPAVDPTDAPVEMSLRLTGRGEMEAATAGSTAHRVLQQAYSAAGTVRVLYWLNAAIMGLGLLALIALIPPSVPGFAVVVGGGAAVFVLYVVGALMVLRHPLLWSLLLACTQTLLVLLNLMVDRLPLLELLMFVFLWVAVVPAVRLHKLLRRDEALWKEFRARIAAKKRARAQRRGRIAQEHRRLRDRKRRGETAEATAALRARERAAEARARKLRATILFGGGTVSAVIVLGLVYFLATRPPSFGSVNAGFLESWNRSAMDDVSEHFHPSRKNSMTRFLERYLARRGFEDRFPVLTDTKLEDRGVRKTAFYLDSSGASFLEIRWGKTEGRWRIIGLGKPD